MRMVLGKIILNHYLNHYSMDIVQRRANEHRGLLTDNQIWPVFGVGVLLVRRREARRKATKPTTVWYRQGGEQVHHI